MDLDEIIEFSAEDPAPNPESILIHSEFTDEVQQHLSELSEGDRAVLIMRYYHEFSEDEICQTLSLSKSAVKSKLHRARRHMAEQWSRNQPNASMEGRKHETQTI